MARRLAHLSCNWDAPLSGKSGEGKFGCTAKSSLCNCFSEEDSSFQETTRIFCKLAVLSESERGGHGLCYPTPAISIEHFVKHCVELVPVSEISYVNIVTGGKPTYFGGLGT